MSSLGLGVDASVVVYEAGSGSRLASASGNTPTTCLRDKIVKVLFPASTNDKSALSPINYMLLYDSSNNLVTSTPITISSSMWYISSGPSNCATYNSSVGNWTNSVTVTISPDRVPLTYKASSSFTLGMVELGYKTVDDRYNVYFKITPSGTTSIQSGMMYAFMIDLTFTTTWTFDTTNGLLSAKTDNNSLCDSGLLSYLAKMITGIDTSKTPSIDCVYWYDTVTNSNTPTTLLSATSLSPNQSAYYTEMTARTFSAPGTLSYIEAGSASPAPLKITLANTYSVTASDYAYFKLSLSFSGMYLSVACQV
ncbi:MAG: hypothetical protein QW320_06640 [Ignisphaera sp.]